MIALGRFAFRFRNLMFPLVFLAALAFSTPEDPFGDEAYDVWMDVASFLVVLAGLAVRAVTIGFEYIVRGGRGKQVYADKLVTGGIYAHTRNPMYLGNSLVVLGIALAVNAPQFYAIVLPLMAIFYAAIIAAEEDFLRGKFGAEFVAYCARVPRLIPRLGGFGRSVEGMRFNWRRVLVKDYSTQFTAIASLPLIDWWQDSAIRRSIGAGLAEHQTTLWFLAAWVALFVVVWGLKKSRRIEAEPSVEHHRA